MVSKLKTARQSLPSERNECSRRWRKRREKIGRSGERKKREAGEAGGWRCPWGSQRLCRHRGRGGQGRPGRLRGFPGVGGSAGSWGPSCREDMLHVMLEVGRG